MRNLIYSLMILFFLSSNLLALNSEKYQEFSNKVDLKDITLNSNDTYNYDILACWIYTAHCSCGSVRTQYCNEGNHGSIEDWYWYLCSELCGDTPEDEEGPNW